MITLADLPQGVIARIIALNGGQGLIQKLSLMGLCEGKIIRVISASPGPIVVEVEKNTIAIGRGMATRILVMRI